MSKASLELGGGNWAAKDGNILGYAVGDTSGKYLPREFDFSRGADIAATRVNKDGLIEKYRENLLLYSNQFNAPWENIRSSDSSGEIGYDGSNNAWKFKDSIDNDTHRIDQNVTLTNNSVYSFSIYAKEGEHNTLGVEIGNFSVTANYVLFNLSDGTTSETGSNIIDSSMTAVGNGWYRCSMTSLAGTADRLCMQVQTGSTASYTGNGTDGIYIQDAQLEYGLVATDYIESGSSTGKAGVLDNLPRIDYTSGSAQLLMEPERKNLVPYSENLGNIAWNKTRCTIDDNDTISPEGVVNGAKMISTDPSESYIQDVLTTTQTKVAWSFWAKKGDLDYVHGLLWDTSANGCRQWFNVSTGELGDATSFGSGYSVDSASIEEYGNGWWRCVMIVNCLVGDQGCRVNISDGNTLITSATNSYGYFYGLQLEDASYATSYIPTYGAQGTRDTDGTSFSSPSMLTGGYDLSSSWSLFVDANSLKKTGSSSVRFLGLHTSGNYNVQLYLNTSASNLGVNPYLQNNGDYVFGYNSNAAGSEDGFKICLTYDAGTNKISYYINGSLYNSTTSALTFGDETYGYIVGPEYSPTATDASVGLKQILFAPTAFSANDSEILTGATSYRSFNVMRSALNYTAYE